MNIYVVMEDGVGVKKIYESWIPLVNPNLKMVSHPSALNDNNFVVYAGGGWPYLYQIIDNAIDDSNTYGNADRIVIAVDSEDKTRADRWAEFHDYVLLKPCHAEIRIVVQHFCFETWALGSKKLIGNTPQTKRLANFHRIFNVRQRDPELMPPNEDEQLNRAQFAFEYLRLAVNEKNRRLSYSKKSPSIVAERHFFDQVKLRLETTGHIGSFADFLSAFADVEANPIRP